MTKSAPIPIVGSLKFGRYSKISAENTYNMIVTENGPARALVNNSGYQSIREIGGGPARALETANKFDHMVAIFGAAVYIIGDELGASKIFDLESSSGPAYIVIDPYLNMIAISDQRKIYYYFYNGSVTPPVVTPTLPTGLIPGPIASIDSYLLVTDLNSGLVYFSTLAAIPQFENDRVFRIGTEGDQALSIATLSSRRDIFVFGSVVTEIWKDVGQNSFISDGTLIPFQRDNAIAINYGVLNAATVAVGFGLVVWLGTNSKSGPVLIFSNGGEARPLAGFEEDGLEFFLDNLSNPSDASGFLFQEYGHIFYQITFYTDNVSLLYDFKTARFFTVTDENMNHHIAFQHTNFNNKNYFLSFDDEKLYELSTDYSTYDGASVPRMRICPSFRLPNNGRFKAKRVTLTSDAGVTAYNQAIDFSMSWNGARSYTPGYRQTIFPLGQYPNQIRFNQLGAGNDLTLRFKFLSGQAVPPIPPIPPDEGPFWLQTPSGDFWLQDPSGSYWEITEPTPPPPSTSYWEQSPGDGLWVITPSGDFWTITEEESVQPEVPIDSTTDDSVIIHNEIFCILDGTIMYEAASNEH